MILHGLGRSWAVSVSDVMGEECAGRGVARKVD